MSALWVLCVMLDRMHDTHCVRLPPVPTYDGCTTELYEWQARAWEWAERSGLDPRGPFAGCIPVKSQGTQT
jgi:hypothetical protein